MLVSIEEKGYKVSINSVGAELKSYRNPDGIELAWPGDPNVWQFSSPLLFPIIGNLRDGKTIIKGKEYSMPKHGLVRHNEFEVDKCAPNKVIFTYKSTKKDLESYPYAFILRLIYELSGDKLDMFYEIENLNDEVMPFNLGAHPGFMCPVNPDERFEDYVIRFEEPETCDSPVYDFENMEFSFTNTKRYFDNSTTLPLDYSLFEKDAIAVLNPKSSRVSIINPSTEKGVSCGISDFEIVAFWTISSTNGPYVCIEPWNGMAVCSDEGDEYEKKRAIQLAEPGSVRRYHLDIQLIGY